METQSIHSSAPKHSKFMWFIIKTGVSTFTFMRMFRISIYTDPSSLKTALLITSAYKRRDLSNSNALKREILRFDCRNINGTIFLGISMKKSGYFLFLSAKLLWRQFVKSAHLYLNMCRTSRFVKLRISLRLASNEISVGVKAFSGLIVLCSLYKSLMLFLLFK